MLLLNFIWNSENNVTPGWKIHEDRHKWQMKQEGWIRFMIKNIWFSLKYGYENNPYEIDDRAAEETEVIAGEKAI